MAKKSKDGKDATGSTHPTAKSPKGAKNAKIKEDVKELEVMKKDGGEKAPPEQTTEKLIKRMGNKRYFKELRRLQIELVKLQEWVKFKGLKVVVIFEGRDAAGKGGMIKRITECLNPRFARVVALPAPTEREKTQWYFQRYVPHLPAAGEMVLMDRSWYNRAGVERVMGFASKDMVERFLRLAPGFEREVIENGIVLLKYFLDVSQDEQRRRFEARITDPVKHWKLSPMDVDSVRRWWDYTKAYQEMISATDVPICPWYVVPADDKRRARLNLISHMLSMIPYERVGIDLPKVPKSQPQPKGTSNVLPATNFVPAVF
jgi:polyphosphate kinase 2